MPTIKQGKCPKCNKNIIANIPFIDGNLHGYKSKDHGCGEEYTLITFIDETLYEDIEDALDVSQD